MTKATPQPGFFARLFSGVLWPVWVIGGSVTLIALLALAGQATSAPAAGQGRLPHLGSDNGFLRVCNSAHFTGSALADDANGFNNGTCGSTDAHLLIDDGRLSWTPQSSHYTYLVQQVLTPAGWRSYEATMFQDGDSQWQPCVPDSGCERRVEYEPGQVWRVIAHADDPNGPVLGSVTFEYVDGS